MTHERPGPYVPLSVLFATGKTGTAIQERFKVAGLGVWAAMLATAGEGNRGEILFRHDEDWSAIGLEVGVALHPIDFTLREFLSFMGRQKQTRTTRQGRALYVQITQWERWNNERKRDLARRRSSRYRRKSERDASVTDSVTDASRDRHPEADTDTESKPKAVSVGPTSDPEWPAEDEEQPWDFNPPELLKEMPA